MTDVEYLRALLADDRLTDDEREAFESMQDFASRTRRPLTVKQSSWARGVAARLELDTAELTGPAFASGAIPRGRPVDMPDVLRVDPKKILPPGRKRNV
jgi:hypothetical protein